MDINIKYAGGIAKMEFEKDFLPDFILSVKKHMGTASHAHIVDSTHVTGIISQFVGVGRAKDYVSIPIINHNSDCIGYVNVYGYKSDVKPTPPDKDKLDQKEINVSLIFDGNFNADKMLSKDRELLISQAKDGIRILQKTEKYFGRPKLSEITDFNLHVKYNVTPTSLETSLHTFFLSGKPGKDIPAFLVLTGWTVEGEPWLDPRYSEDD